MSEAGGPGQAGGTARACPFCRVAAPDPLCPACGRDTTQARRPCRKCAAQVPAADAVCHACGAAMRDEMIWKIPLIVAIFVIFIVLAVVLRVFD